MPKNNYKSVNIIKKKKSRATLHTCGVHYFVFPDSIWFPEGGYSPVLAASQTFSKCWPVAFASWGHFEWDNAFVFLALFLMSSFLPEK